MIGTAVIDAPCYHGIEHVYGEIPPTRNGVQPPTRRADTWCVMLGGNTTDGVQPRVARYLLEYLHAHTDATWILGPSRVGTSFPVLDPNGEARTYLSLNAAGDHGRYEELGLAVASALASITRAESGWPAPVEQLEQLTVFDGSFEGGRIVTYFQPIVALRTGEVVAIEALARWQTPDGVLPPSAFIEQFNNQELMLALFDHMLESTLQFLSDHRHRMPDLSAAVNLELAGIPERGLADLIGARLAEFDTDPEALTIELNERLAYHLSPPVIDELRRVAATGVKLVLDDVVAAFDAIHRLPGVPIAGAKLDRRHVNQLTAGDHEQHVIRAILARAASAGIDVIAEGVETQTQCDRLARLGCHFGQGYLFAVPQPASSLSAVLESPLATTW